MIDPIEFESDRKRRRACASLRHHHMREEERIIMKEFFCTLFPSSPVAEECWAMSRLPPSNHWAGLAAMGTKVKEMTGEGSGKKE